MKISITKNQNDLLSQLNLNASRAVEQAKAAQAISEQAQGSLGSTIRCIALDGGWGKDKQIERFVLQEEDGKFFLSLPEPEQRIAQPLEIVGVSEVAA